MIGWRCCRSSEATGSAAATALDSSGTQAGEHTVYCKSFQPHFDVGQNLRRGLTAFLVFGDISLKIER